MNELHLDRMNRISFQQLSEYSVTNSVEDKVVLIDNLSLFPFGKPKEGVIAADCIAWLFCTKGCLEINCAFYANQLCVTPKYLTMVVKKVSGKGVSQWIDTYLMEQILFHLKITNLSIAEIAYKLNFSNASFFGKYVKVHTGESPTKLRRTLQTT